MTHFEGKRLYLTEFDETLDAAMLDVVELISGPKTKAQNFEVWINSDGGDAHRAFAIVELLEYAKERGVVVKTFVLHSAHSAASIVSVAGSPGHRVIAKRGRMLIHYGQVETTFAHPMELERVAKEQKAHFAMMRRHYLQNTTIKPKELDDVLRSDQYHIDATAAIAWGFADSLL